MKLGNGKGIVTGGIRPKPLAGFGPRGVEPIPRDYSLGVLAGLGAEAVNFYVVSVPNIFGLTAFFGHESAP